MISDKTATTSAKASALIMAAACGTWRKIWITESGISCINFNQICIPITRKHFSDNLHGQKDSGSGFGCYRLHFNRNEFQMTRNPHTHTQIAYTRHSNFNEGKKYDTSPPQHCLAREEKQMEREATNKLKCTEITAMHEYVRSSKILPTVIPFLAIRPR